MRMRVFRVSNWSSSPVTSGWLSVARISRSWYAWARVLLRRGMNLAAQNTLFPLCCTLFTKPNTPLGRGEGDQDGDAVPRVLGIPGARRAGVYLPISSLTS